MTTKLQTKKCQGSERQESFDLNSTRAPRHDVGALTTTILKDLISASPDRETTARSLTGPHARQRQIVSCDDGDAVLDLYFNNLIYEKLFRSKVCEKTIQELPLFVGGNLRDNDDQPGVNRFSGIKFSEVLGIVCNKGEIPIDDVRHQAPVRFAAQPDPVDVACFMSASLRYRNEGRVQALIDKKSHEVTRVYPTGGGRLSRPCASTTLFSRPSQKASWVARASGEQHSIS